MKRDLFTEDHDLFRQNFRQFCEKEIVPHQEQWLENGIVTRDIWKKAGDNGFLIPFADEAYGGLGLKDFRYSQIMIEELSEVVWWDALAP